MPSLLDVDVEECFAGLWFERMSPPGSVFRGLDADAVEVDLRACVACGSWYDAVSFPFVLVLLVDCFVEAADVLVCQCDGLISRGVEFQALVSPVERPAVYAEGCGRWELCD